MNTAVAVLVVVLAVGIFLYVKRRKKDAVQTPGTAGGSTVNKN